MDIYNYPSDDKEAARFFTDKIENLKLSETQKILIENSLWLDYIYARLLSELKTKPLSQTYTHKIVDLQCEISGLRGLVCSLTKNPGDTSLDKAVSLSIRKIAGFILPEAEIILKNPVFRQKLIALLPNPLQ